jgi:hypothetical protein
MTDDKTLRSGQWQLPRLGETATACAAETGTRDV